MDIQSCIAKKKSSPIVKWINRENGKVEAIIEGLTALGEIGDETAQNEIAHYFYHPDFSVRLAACKAGLKMNKEYLRTNVRHLLDLETDENNKREILKAFDDAAKN